VGKNSDDDKTLGASLSPRNKMPESPMEESRLHEPEKSMNVTIKVGLADLIFIIPKEFYFMNVFLPNQPLIKHVTSTS
jgi:hypothetical protein